MKCPTCGTESDGNFCPSCGAALRSGTCGDCGADLVQGARFCTRCGAAAGAAAGSGAAGSRAAAASNPNLPWYLAGGVLLLLIAILLVPLLVDGRGDASAGRTPDAVAPGTPPPLTGTPREQADRLFNRIMTARDRGDTAEVLRFSPMAVAAYGMAEPLDNDGLYHLATVHAVAGDAAAALAAAGRILERNPDHLLALAVAAEAATLAGDDDAARTYHQRLLNAWETEIDTGLQEYQDHARILPEYRAAAERATG